MKHYGDITKLSGYDLPVVDCICGGSPCQNLSVAGNQKGLEGSESRLFLEQVRIVKEMLNNGRSNGSSGLRFMVWENVPGAMQTNGGRDFQRVLSEIVQICEPNAPAVPMPKSGKWTKSGCLYDDMGGWSVAWRIHNSEFWGVPQKRRRIALVADFRGLAAPEVLFERKGLRGDSEESRATREDSSATAKSGFADTISFKERAGKPGGGKGILIQAEKTGTIGTHNNQSVYKHVYGASSFGEYKSGVAHLRRLGGADGSNNLVAETFGSLCASDFKGIRNQDIDQNKCLLTDGVRRITPTEAERLQGFPDGWTDLTEWTDTKGKVHKETPDTARYKALGNSIALPFWFWLLRRISAQYERPATLGSLFDGIGGFPLCWERCNGPGTAIWASEIEEFPIAVTKKHFPE